GPLPLKIKVNGSISKDPEGTLLKFAWLKDGKAVSTDAKTTLIFTEPGDHPITLNVTDAQGATNEFTQYVSAGNSPPKLAFQSPLDGSFFTLGKPLKYRLAIQDNEEGNSKLKPNSFASTVVTLAPLAKVSPGLSAIRASDCFNCHHASQKLIGPSFNDIAKRYKGNAAAFDSSVERVIKGSSKVWGEVPMLPHPNLKRNQVASMVRWIYSLSEKNTPQVSRGIEGNMTPSSVNQSLELSANFTDLGAYEGKATPLSGGTSIRLHPRTIEAENFSSHKGPQILDGDGFKFVGAINHSHWIEYPGFRIKDCKNFTVRYASGGAGAKITLTANGKKIAAAEIKPTGGWDKWKETTVPLRDLPDGLVDLRLTFTNPGKQHLVNLDWIHFE
ncbi:carbohydrate-binding protein, partial [Akkermansiaceae bacterium]|nr:carbohydrate-binding protein [Akkermansiaceae bacterium]